MKTIDQYQIKVCTDCLMGIVNDAYTGLQYYLDEKEADQRMEEIKQGIRTLYRPDYKEASQVILGATSEEETFSTDVCECCGDTLAGTRHIMNKLEVTSK